MQTRGVRQPQTTELPPFLIGREKPGVGPSTSCCGDHTEPMHDHQGIRRASSDAASPSALAGTD